MNDSVQVGAKGRTTLIAVSLDRQDKLQEIIKLQEPLKLHAACRKAYTQVSYIKSEES